MQKLIKQNNLNQFDLFIILVCITICLGAIALKTNLIYIDFYGQVSSSLKVAHISEIDNDVRVKKNNVFFWKDSRVDENLGQGESIFVGGSSQAVIEFINGDQLKVSENTIIRIKYDRENNINQLELAQGNIELKSKSDSKLTINGMDVKTKGNSSLSINNTKSKLQFISKKGDIEIGNLILEEGTISDGAKITKAFDVDFIGGNHIVTTKDKTKVQIQFSKLDEKIDDYKLYVTNSLTGFTEAILFNKEKVQFDARPGKHIAYAEAYINGQLIGLSPKVQFEITKVGSLGLVYPNPNEKYAYIPEDTSLRIVWNKTCDCEYDVKIYENKGMVLVKELKTSDSFIDFQPRLITYRIKIVAYDQNLEVDSIINEISFKSSKEFNPKLLFKVFGQTAVFVNKKVPLNIASISNAKVNNLKLVLSRGIDFQDSFEVPYHNNGFLFDRGGSYYYKAVWKYNNETIEKVSSEMLEVIDLTKLLSPPEALEETRYRKIQSVEITATQTLKWASSNTHHATFYRIEIADNKNMKNSKVVETDVNTVDITLKESKQYWRIKKIVRIDNVLYEGSYSSVFEIKAYDPPEFTEQEKVKENTKSNIKQAKEKPTVVAKKDKKKPLSKNDEALQNVEVPNPTDLPEDSVPEFENRVAAPKNEGTKRQKTMSKPDSGKSDDVVAEVPEPEGLDNAQFPTFDRPTTTTGRTPVKPSASSGDDSVNVTSSPVVRSVRAPKVTRPNKKAKQKKSGPLKRVAVPGIPGISIIQGGDESADTPAIARPSVNNVSPKVSEPVALANLSTDREVKQALLNAPVQQSINGVSVGGKPAPKIVFTPKKNINLRSNKVQIEVDNFDKNRVKYAKFTFENKSKTVPMRTGKLTLKADKMPSRSKIFLLDKMKKPISSMKLDLEPFYKNGCMAPKYKVVKVIPYDDSAVIKIKLKKGKHLFLNFKPAKAHKGFLKISLNKEYTLSLCNSKTVSLFKNNDLARVKVKSLPWQLYAGVTYNSLSYKQSGTTISGSAVGVNLNANYLISASRFQYRGKFEYLSGDYDGGLSFSFFEMDHSLLYNLLVSNYELHIGPLFNMIAAQEANTNGLDTKSINMFGMDLLAIYPLSNVYNLTVNLKYSVSAQSSSAYTFSTNLSRGISDNLEGDIFLQQRGVNISNSDLVGASLTRTSLGLGIRYLF